MWSNEAIIYQDQVRIAPPYTADSCVLTAKAKTMRNGDRALTRVKNLIHAFAKAKQ